MVYHRIKKSPGFTLAEVLITLGIIGVVAALTLPTLISNYRNKVLAVQTRKTYSIINQALQRYQADSGNIGVLTGLFDVTKSSEEVLKNFSKYFSSPTICTDYNSNICKNYKYRIKYNYPMYNKDNIASGEGAISVPFMVLNDGTAISVHQYDSCSRKTTGIAYNPDGTPQKNPDGSVVTYEYTESVCAYVDFDINGPAKPNTFGADAYRINIRENLDFSSAKFLGWNSLQEILQGGNPVYSKYELGDKKED